MTDPRWAETMALMERVVAECGGEDKVRSVYLSYHPMSGTATAKVHAAHGTAAAIAHSIADECSVERSIKFAAQPKTKEKESACR